MFSDIVRLFHPHDPCLRTETFSFNDIFLSGGPLLSWGGGEGGLLLVELLCTFGARAEPNTLENLVTHRSQKFWLSRDCPYVRPSVHPYVLTSVRQVP